MDERIWSLPGPRTLITDTVGELKAGRHVFIALPAAMATDPAVTERVGELSHTVVNIAGVIGAALVVAIGTYLQRRHSAQAAQA